MRIGRSIVRTTSQLTVDADMDFLGSYQVKNLATPAAGEALKKGYAGIVDADIAAGAAILRSKLNFGDGLVDADIAAAAAVAQSKIAGAFMESGQIVIWHGSIASIPAGFVICDGNNSTPNLLTKFIQGVATAATNPGATGGEATHTLSTAELASHNHSILCDQTSSGTNTPAKKGSTTNNPYNSETAGSGSAHENEPTFYDVAFLMKT